MKRLLNKIQFGVVQPLLRRVSGAYASLPFVEHDALWKAAHVARLEKNHARHADHAYKLACRNEHTLLLKNVYLWAGDHHRDRVFELREMNKALLTPATRLRALRKYNALHLTGREMLI